jgi:hypothetical protein
MKLSLALALLTLGGTSTLGNAFASPNISFVSKSTAEKTSALSFAKAPNAVRGGDNNSSTCLDATREDLSIDKVVSEYISQDNWDLLSDRGKAAISNLIHGDEGVNAQSHVYANWPEKGTNDEGKVSVTEQVSSCFMLLETLHYSILWSIRSLLILK